MFKVTFKTQQQCINILLRQHVSVFLDHLQVSRDMRTTSCIWVLAWRWDTTLYLWKLVWRLSNEAETCCHNKILIFIHCCV